MTTAQITPPPPPDAAEPRVLTSTKTGVVISDKRAKSRTVVIDYPHRHPKYGKIMRRQTKFQVHDEKNESKLGDLVEIVNCRPISKTKSWRLVRVVNKSVGQIEHKTEV